MTVFDIVVLTLVGIGAVVGFKRGLVQEVLSLAAWFVAAIAVRLVHAPLTIWLTEPMGSATTASVLAFTLLLLIPLGIMKLIATQAGTASRKSLLGPIDRVLGFGFGGLKGVLVVVFGFSILVLGYDTVWGPSGRPDWLTSSRTYPLVNAASDQLVETIGERRRAMDESGEDPGGDTGIESDPV